MITPTQYVVEDTNGTLHVAQVLPFLTITGRYAEGLDAAIAAHTGGK